MTGTVVNDRYRIESEVGSGGMAEVYKAYDLEEKRYVAIKVIKSEYCKDPQYIRRFDCEADTVLSLKCKNIVGAYDFGSFEGRRYIVLEYVEGCTLKESLREHGAINPKAAVKIACCVLDALECAHNAGFIHRDVKPQNVMISTDKSIKLTDFGIAKAAEATTRTYDGSSVIGSVHYISPEQAKGEPVERTSDLYSVGIMLFEMLTGRPPFDGENSVQIALKHINDSIEPPHEIDSAIPPALSDVIVKATAKDVSVRYQSAAAMRADLLRALAHPKRHFVRIDDIQDTAALNIKDTETTRPRTARMWHVVLPVTLLVAVIVGIFAFWYKYMMANTDKENLSRVPNLYGRTVEEAQELCDNRDFIMRIVGTITSDSVPEGSVYSQNPDAGTTQEKGTVIDVVLSSGSDTVSMINLIGYTLEQASYALKDMDIDIELVSYAESEASPGTIIWQSIGDGDAAVKGDTVDVAISGTQGVTQVPMPELTRFKSPQQAVELLNIYGFTDIRFKFASKEMLALFGETPKDGVVVSQNPSAGIPVIPSNTHVDVYICFDANNAAYADFSHSFVVDADSSQMVVAVETEMGEFVVYETELKAGTRAVEFRATYVEKGTYTCIIYINNIEVTRLEKEFIK